MTQGARDGPTPDMVIPVENLPPGFIERISNPPDQAVPARPAATAVPLRDENGALEVLLLKRNRSAGFVPGAYVFPGGVVDDADAHSEVQKLVRSPLSRAADRRAGAPPSLGFWVAAARELFEETGVLMASAADGADSRPDAGRRGGVLGPSEDVLRDWRDALLEDRITIRDLLRDASLTLDLDRLTHFAHWITPVAERRRYDTHFFIAAMPERAEVRIDAREMTDAQWLTPAEALRRFAAGALPMVFPTVKTIESLARYDSVRAAIQGLGGREVRPILPRLVRDGSGVGILIDEAEVEGREGN